jgi:hypothetical protein
MPWDVNDIFEQPIKRLCNEIEKTVINELECELSADGRIILSVCECDRKKAFSLRRLIEKELIMIKDDACVDNDEARKEHQNYVKTQAKELHKLAAYISKAADELLAK